MRGRLDRVSAPPACILFPTSMASLILAVFKSQGQRGGWRVAEPCLGAPLQSFSARPLSSLALTFPTAYKKRLHEFYTKHTKEEET